MISRNAFITGAAQGIGEAIVLRLASEHEEISFALLDVKGKEGQLHDVVKKIELNGRKAIYITGDVSVEEDVKTAVDKCVEVYGGLDIMVANAGIVMFKPFLETTVEDFHKIINVNLLGVALCFQYAARQMIKQGRGGRIIGASSGAGKQGIKNIAVYSASKFAVRGLTQATSHELRPHNITVNSYAPGFILTPMNAHPDDHKFGGLGSVAQRIVGAVSDLEGAEPDVIAELVAYLITPKAHFTTGQTISVNGGSYFD